jgi:YmgG-like glycine-zipper protein
MRKLTLLALVPAAMLAAACGRNRGPAIDDALKNDLALASQAQIGNAPISPTEAGYAPSQSYASSSPRATTSTARRTTSSSRRTSSSRSSGSRSSNGGGYYPAPAPQTTIEKHTGRDAAIGAAAGAVIGATTSRDKIKGAIIGGAAGGILGAVIGNNVDVKRKVGW